MSTDARPHDSDHPLIHCLWQAFHDYESFKALLARPEQLREIMNTVEVRQWLFEVVQRRPDGRECLIRMMEASKMIRGRGYIAEDIYTNAYARTWEWFTKKLPTYDPKQASFVHWFNKKLSWSIQDVIRERAKDPVPLPDGFEPQAPVANRQWQETVEEWIDLVERHASDLCRCRMQGGHAHINCHDLLLMILRAMLVDTFTIDEVNWDTLAHSQDISPASLKRFCQSRCFRTFQRLL